MKPILLGRIASRSFGQMRHQLRGRNALGASARGVLITLIAWFTASPAQAHGGPNLLFPETDYIVKWHQPHGAAPVNDWDVEVNPIDGSGKFVIAAQVMPDDSCWSVNVPVTKPALVRIRAVSGNQVSHWSPVTSVPEPGFALASFLGVGLLSGLASRRGRRRSLDRLS